MTGIAVSRTPPLSGAPAAAAAAAPLPPDFLPPDSLPPDFLPPVPVLDACGGGTIAVAEARPQDVARLVSIGRRHYTPVGLALADHWSRRWLVRTHNPYLPEVDAVTRRLQVRGAYALNLSYEWACTAGVDPVGTGAGPRLLRTLDWGMPGLGETLVIVRRDGEAGPWLDLTWPGLIGSVTVMAPGRFAAAINMPPVRRRGLPLPADWVLNRIDFLRSAALPPMHLLRHVAETARDYDAALKLIVETPVAAAAYFSIAGIREGEGAVVERTEDEAVVHRDPAVIANHWITPAFRRRGNRPRTSSSFARHAAMAERYRTACGLEWVSAPILDPTTRLAARMEPRDGRLLVRGYGAGAPVTAETSVAA